MTDLAAPVARIILRYLSGALVGWGLLGADDAALFASPEVERIAALVVGGALGAVSEAAYAVARKTGAPT
jgi:hypothetical protein